MFSNVIRLGPPSDDATNLPSKMPADTYSPWPWRNRTQQAFIPKRYGRILIAVFVTLVTLTFFLHSNETGLDPLVLLPPGEETDLPPLYRQYTEYERGLPQHNPALPYPEGRHAKFIFFANHGHGAGWGNALQEMVLNAHLAYSSHRAFVFDNYTWNRDDPSDYSDFGGKKIPSRIPLSAMISGPMVGGSYGRHSDVPRAVSRNYYNEVCTERVIINSAEVRSTLQTSPTAQETLDAWVAKLTSMDDRCVEIMIDTPQLFDIWIVGSTAVLDIWPSFSVSPILTKFSWSPLILNAYINNAHLFESPGFLQKIPDMNLMFSSHKKGPSEKALRKLAATPPPPLQGLLTLHVRRGDFNEHCYNLAHWGAVYNGFNSFPEFKDRFDISLPEDTPNNEREAIYLKHCYPSVEEIVSRVMDIKSSAKAQKKSIRRVYIMTNGSNEWVDELKAALWAATSDWEAGGVVSSRDLRLSWEEKFVAQILDMYVAERAQVFVGNGFSSLTSNVVMLRMANGLDPQDTRFW